MRDLSKLIEKYMATANRIAEHAATMQRCTNAAPKTTDQSYKE
jgi:hypothetical protein